MDTSNNSTSVIPGDEIQLSITKNYARSWETWEGVREMVQNWHDGLFTASHRITKDELKFKKVYMGITLYGYCLGLIICYQHLLQDCIFELKSQQFKY